MSLKHSWLRISRLFGAAALSTLSVTGIATDLMSPVDRLGRCLGVGYGDGYHACCVDRRLPTADMPIRRDDPPVKRKRTRSIYAAPVCANHPSRIIPECGAAPYLCQSMTRTGKHCDGPGCDAPSCDQPSCDSFSGYAAVVPTVPTVPSMNPVGPERAESVAQATAVDLTQPIVWPWEGEEAAEPKSRMIRPTMAETSSEAENNQPVRRRPTRIATEPQSAQHL